MERDARVDSGNLTPDDTVCGFRRQPPSSRNERVNSREPTAFPVAASGPGRGRRRALGVRRRAAVPGRRSGLSVRGDPRRRGRDRRRGRERVIGHGPSGFLGELNLLSGQTVFVNALVIEPLRYIAVERSALRSLLNEDGPLSDLLLLRSSPGARRCRACRGSAWRSSARTVRSRRCACSSSRARTGSRTPGRRQPRPTAAHCHSCDCRAEESCTAQPPARCCALSGSGSNSHLARRSTS